MTPWQRRARRKSNPRRNRRLLYSIRRRLARPVPPSWRAYENALGLRRWDSGA